MLYIEFSQTFRKIEAAASKYNQQYECMKDNVFVERDPGAREKVNDIKKMLRDTHVSLMKKLIECLSSQLQKDQKMAGGYDIEIVDQNVFTLRTNNVALGKAIGVSPRTVYNRLKRLLDANFLISKSFNGTRSDFKIGINLDLLFATLNGNPLLMSAVKNSVEKGLKTEDFAEILPEIPEELRTKPEDLTGKEWKKIVLTEKRKLYKKNIIIGSGETVDKSTISGSLMAFKGNTTNQESPANSVAFSEKKSENSPAVKDLPQKKETFTGAAAENSDNISPEIQRYGIQLMNFMYATIFSRMHYHAPSQLQASRDFIIRELSGLSGRELKAKFKEIQLRIQLAWEWVERDPNNRYIPNSPAKYFDPENPNGFNATKFWYAKFVKDKRQLKEANERTEELMYNWRTLHKMLDRYKKDPNFNNYFKIKRDLDRLAPEISETFEQLVVYNNNKLTA